MVPDTKTRGWRPIMVIMMAFAILCFLFRIREVLLAFIAGAAIAYVLYRPVFSLERKGLQRPWAILIVYSSVAVFFTTLVWAAIPAVIREIGGLAQLYPDYVREMHSLAAHVDRIPKPTGIQQLVAENVHYVEETVYQAIQNFINSLYRLLGKMLAIVFAPILAFYMLADWEHIRNGCMSLLSPAARRESQQLLQQMDVILYEYLKGYLVIAAVVGLTSGLAAALIGVRFPLAIGFMIGVTNLIPCFGAFLGGVPAVAIAWSQSLHHALYMALAVVVIQQLDANLFTPRIIGGKLGLHPLLVIFSLLAGASLFGVWGMLVAVPVTAVLRVLGQWVFLKLVA